MRRWLLFGSLALFGLIVLILGFGYLRENVGRAQETVAVVYGERLTAGDLLERSRPALRQLESRLTAYRSQGLTQQALQLQFQRQQLPETVLDELIEERLLRRETEQRGVTISAAQVDEKVRELVAESDAALRPQPTPTPSPTAVAGVAPTATPAGTATPRPTPTAAPTLTEDRFAPALQEYLNNTGLSEPQLRSIVEVELISEALRGAIGAEVPTSQEQVRARHLVFQSEEQARAALERLQSGSATFEQLAEEQAATPGQPARVELGWLPRLGRDPKFDQALFELQPGERSDAVQTVAGWEIIEALERQPDRPLEPDHLESLRRQRFNDWLSALKNSPEVSRELSSDEASWIVQQAGGRRV